MSTSPSSSSLAGYPKAILGPTNTGKTWYALERMLGYQSGMFGFPLRLLARENYDRAVAKVGSSAVALITGEEKLVPPDARYFLCTVEAMPLQREVDFLAIDEVQLAADPERGHIFTDRILHARGREETLLLGAETARPFLEALIPDIKTNIRPRLSRLVWGGAKKLTRLPRRSAIVAFSAAEVYRLAEIMRAHRGGTAVVMGALSPRTRNAQVGLFQSGEVDYMVATDAIGMGLNMDIVHVGLAGDMKFDGKRLRPLVAAELGQIAGRAGRHMRDGSFGITDACPMLKPETIDAIENHRFKPLKRVWWRNSALDFTSLDALLASLEKKPPLGLLSRKSDASDHLALLDLMSRKEVKARARDEASIALLYEVCQVPDYQRSYSDSHGALLARIFSNLVEGRVLPHDWVSSSLEHLNRVDGNIDTLMARLSGVRVWSYITQRGGWLSDSEAFGEIARGIEDRVSDSLNRLLMERFVDRRISVLFKGLSEGASLVASIKPDGRVLVEGEDVGDLSGFVFRLGVEGVDKDLLMSAARKALMGEVSLRVKALVSSLDDAFKVGARGEVFWREAEIGRLVKGDSLHLPRAEVHLSDLLEGDNLKKVQKRLSDFASSIAAGRLSKLVDLVSNDDLSGVARGVAYQVYEGLGVVPSGQVSDLLKELDEEGKAQLARRGIRLGIDMIYMPDLLKPAEIEVKALLYGLWFGEWNDFKFLSSGVVAFDKGKGGSDEYWLALGYRRLGERYVRVDIGERLSALVRQAARSGKFSISEEMVSLVGTTHEHMQAMVVDLGYRRVKSEGEGEASAEKIFFEKKPVKKQRKSKKASNKKASKKKAKSKTLSKPKVKYAKKKEKQPDPASPFAVLAKLKNNANSKTA